LQESFKERDTLRSAKTNALQMAVLISGAIYIIIGLAFMISPIIVFKLFLGDIPEDWINLVGNNESLIASLYYMARVFGVLILSAGFLMIMPLFDPLKYRGIVYLNGAFFPFVSAIILLKNGLFIDAKSDDAIKGDFMHVPIVILGIVLSVIFIMVMVTLLITRKDAKEGRE